MMYGDMNPMPAILILGAVIGMAIMAIIFWLIPWLWELIKPWLHLITA